MKPRLFARTRWIALLVPLEMWSGSTSPLAVAGFVERAQESWYVDYDNGLRAIERSDWAAAVRHLQSAVAKNPRSSLTARTYGMRYIRYVPHFYLGVSHYNMGDSASALSAIGREKDAREILKSRELAHQLAVIDSAARGATGPAAVIAAANATQQERLQRALALGVAALQRGRHREAYVIFGSILAVDPRHAAARAYRDSTRARALAGELESIEVAARGTAGDTAAPAARSETAILESKGWELVRRARGLLERGIPDSALAKLDLALTLAADLPGVTQLVEEAKLYRAAAELEVRREAEMARQQQIVAAAPAKDAPRIAVVTPVNVEEETSGEIVAFQGTVIDRSGIARVEIEVNGRGTSAVALGQRTRGIVRKGEAGTQRDSLTGAQGSKGTIVNFYHEVALTEPLNGVVIRARNTSGVTTEVTRTVRRSSSKPKIWAAIIGVARYQQPGVPALRYTIADADGFARYLTDQLGVPREQIFTLYDTSATTPRIKSILGTELRRKAARGDLVLIYFAGHGAPETDAANRDGDGMEKYLLTIESTLDDLYGSALSMNAVGEVFDRIQAERIVLIADACYSGAAGGRTINAPRQGPVSDRFLDRVAGAGKRRVIMAASSANELSHERSDLGHGVFTFYFLEALRGKGDANTDGLITVDEAYRYVSLRVPEATGQLQHPVLKGEIAGDVVLGRVKP